MLLQVIFLALKFNEKIASLARLIRFIDNSVWGLLFGPICTNSIKQCAFCKKISNARCRWLPVRSPVLCCERRNSSVAPCSHENVYM